MPAAVNRDERQNVDGVVGSTEAGPDQGRCFFREL